MKYDRRLRRVGPADHRHAHGHPRLQHRRRASTRSTAGQQRTGMAASAARCWAKPGSTITATTARRARAASSRQAQSRHPIVRGIDGDIWGPTDVYGVRLPLPGDCKPLVLGQVLEGMKPTDKPVAGPKNDPMMPVAWIKTYTGASGKTARVFRHHRWAGAGPAERRAPQAAGQRLLLVAGHGRKDHATTQWTSSANTNRRRSSSVVSSRG